MAGPKTRKLKTVAFQAYFLREVTKTNDSGDTILEVTLKVENPKVKLQKDLVDFKKGYELLEIAIVELPEQPLRKS